ncbi:Scm-like with four MBT domains protein 1 [Nymphon striatum]|nr:Scm-like with four MBT domains protein 1 [Nymphon striatum]
MLIVSNTFLVLCYRSWLLKNLEESYHLLLKTNPIRDEIARIHYDISNKIHVKDIIWDCSYGLSHKRGCFQSFQNLMTQHPVAMNALNGKTIVFSTQTGVSLDGHVILNIEDVRQKWLDVIKSTSFYDDRIKLFPEIENNVSMNLNGIKIGHRKFQPSVSLADYEKRLKKLVFILEEHKQQYPNLKFPNYLREFELVIECESGPLMLSPTGQIIAPCSYPVLLLLNFIHRNFEEAKYRMKNSNFSSKCKVMHLGHKTPGYKFFMNVASGSIEWLKETEEQKDLVVWVVNNKLAFSAHATKAATISILDPIEDRPEVGNQYSIQGPNMPSKPDDDSSGWKEINITIEPSLPNDILSKSEADSVNIDFPTSPSTNDSTDIMNRMKENTFLNLKKDDFQLSTEEPKLLTEIERRETERNRKGCGLKRKGKSRKITGSRHVIKQNESIDCITEEEPEFVWEDYLEETGSIAAPPAAFLHVEKSLENGFKESMMLEICYDREQEHYWFANIILTCGPLLSLRYLGNENKTDEDFWCDINNQEVHPLGWCKEKLQKMIPPSDIIENCKDWEKELLPKVTSFQTPPDFVFENGMTPIDQIRQGIVLEIQDDAQPNNVWLASVIKNVGGRLLLRYEGCSDSSFDFWLYYISWQLHAPGWAKINGYQYQPPKKVQSPYIAAEPIIKVLHSPNQTVYSHDKKLTDIFLDQEEVLNHNFEVGMKLEMLSPVDRLHFVPATITNILCDKFFLVELDDFTEVAKKSYFCHSGCWNIFPPGWAKENGLKVQIPKGCNILTSISRSLDWDEYLKMTGAIAAIKSSFKQKVNEKIHAFDKSMRLEAVNPFQPQQLCAASITKIVSHLIWIQLDGVDAFNVHHITSINSYEIFPVGWCESNSFPLKPPRKWLSKRQRKLLAKKSHQDNDANGTEPMLLSPSKCDICPKLYINHRCFSGRFLSKSKIAELPRHVGPGPVQLVIKEVINLLIASAYISTRVHKELQLEGKPNPNMNQSMMKAKYKGKVRKGIIEIPYYAEQVEAFCKEIYIVGAFSKKTKRLWNPPKKKSLLKDKKDSSDYESEKSFDSDEPPKKKLLMKQSYSPEEDKVVPIIQTNNLTQIANPNGNSSNQPIQNLENSLKLPIIDNLLPRIIDIPKLLSNPLNWSVRDVIEYFRNSDCHDVIPKLRDQEIDGLAILLLTLPAIRDCLCVKLGPAIRLCKHVEKLRMAFLLQYCKG